MSPVHWILDSLGLWALRQRQCLGQCGLRLRLLLQVAPDAQPSAAPVGLRLRRPRGACGPAFVQEVQLDAELRRPCVTLDSRLRAHRVERRRVALLFLLLGSVSAP